MSLETPAQNALFYETPVELALPNPVDKRLDSLAFNFAAHHRLQPSKQSSSKCTKSARCTQGKTPHPPSRRHERWPSPPSRRRSHQVYACRSAADSQTWPTHSPILPNTADIHGRRYLSTRMMPLRAPRLVDMRDDSFCAVVSFPTGPR